MQNPEVIKLIENLKGRRNYEEKKAKKLGFSSLYQYLEDKILKQKKSFEDKEKEFQLINLKKKSKQKIAPKKIVAVVAKIQKVISTKTICII